MVTVMHFPIDENQVKSRRHEAAKIGKVYLSREIKDLLTLVEQGIQ